ncbi:MAG: DUF1501 domain-containing protein [Bdellovibrionales bacterium]
MPRSSPSLFLNAAPVITGDGKFFVLCRVFFGMDVTLGLDPWLAAAPPLETDMFVEYTQNDLIDINGKLKLGPAAAALKNHAGDFSVINGVFMSQVDNGHPASMTLITKTSHNQLSPCLPVEMALACPESDFGVLSNTSLDMGTKVATSSNLRDLAQIQNKFDVSTLLSALFGSDPSKTPYMTSVRKVVASRDSVQAFIKNLGSMGPDPKDIHVTAAAFMTEMSCFAQLDFTNFQLDTHSGHPGTHLAQQTKAWNAIDELFTLFKKTEYGAKGESLFDYTTFMVVSEFSRTPALNPAKGKDHNPMTNSVLLAGRGVVGGQAVGASRLVTAQESLNKASYHIAYPINYATGEVQYTRTKESQMIFPENVGQTVATIMGVDRTVFNSIPANTLPLSRLIKT